MEGIVAIVVKIVIGGLIGWVASILMRTNAQMGLIANVVVGIVGALLGHWLAPMVGIAATSTVASLGISLAGAVLLIVVLRFLGLFR